MKNLSIFKKLALKYESTKESDIKKAVPGVGETYGKATANSLTGFGQTETCSLCGAIHTTGDLDELDRCEGCVYMERTGSHCSTGPNKETYEGIEKAADAKELKEAFNKRAKYMRGILK